MYKPPAYVPEQSYNPPVQTPPSSYQSPLVQHQMFWRWKLKRKKWF
jgi:hypothetical protein